MIITPEPTSAALLALSGLLVGILAFSFSFPATKLALEVAKEFPRTIFFSGKLIFEEQAWYQRILHNETAHAIQHRLQFAGHPMVVLPVRVRARELQESAPEKKAA